MSNLLKLFISVPLISAIDRSPNEIIDKAYRRASRISKDISTIYLVPRPINKYQSDIYTLGMSICKMDEADIIYFCKGWENDRICSLEHDVAMRYYKNVIYEEDDN